MSDNVATRTLQQWLDYQQRVHPRDIELGLDRVREVWQRMGSRRLARNVITVGGTNGKGSTVAFLEATLRAGGMRVGAYTSPHILRYNERVRVAGIDVDDDALIVSFEHIENARGADSNQVVPLTYFEFGTLAALDIFSRAQLDVVLLEVGLGGRLDAVNIIDSDCAIVTTVDMDHMEYLGNDRMTIGREKAGIFRANKPAVIGEENPPQSLLEEAQRIGAEVILAGRDYQWVAQSDSWMWREIADGKCKVGGAWYDESGDLVLQGDFQHRNAAAAIAALHALGTQVRWDARAIVKCSIKFEPAEPFLAGRLQTLARGPIIIVDVAHNPQAARALARWLDANPVAGETCAVFGALADKDVEGIVTSLDSQISHWHLAGLENASPRGLPVARLAERVRASLPDAACSEYADVAAALIGARANAEPQDRILAFGSFFVVAAVMREFPDATN